MVTHERFEWGHFDRAVFFLVMGKFRECDMGEPVFTAVIAEDPKIDFKFLIDALSLSISLRVIHR